MRMRKICCRKKAAAAKKQQKQKGKRKGSTQPQIDLKERMTIL
jgi:hypothetical protein